MFLKVLINRDSTTPRGMLYLPPILSMNDYYTDFKILE